MSEPAHPLSVSVVTPSYEQAAYLERTLESVRTQTADRIEHIVVDGGSTDGTVELLERYEREHGDEEGYHLRWLSEPDRGQSHAVNKGLEMATGDWIGWQNSDDFYLDGAFAALADAVDTHPGVDVVYGDLEIYDGDGTYRRTKHHTRPSRFIQRHYSMFTANQCTFFSRRAFETLGPLDESFDYAMDTELFDRVLESDLTARHVPVALGGFREHEDAKTAVVTPTIAAERESLYGDSPGKRLLPESVLRLAAVGLKTAYVLADGRPGVVFGRLRDRL